MVNTTLTDCISLASQDPVGMVSQHLGFFRELGKTDLPDFERQAILEKLHEKSLAQAVRFDPNDIDMEIKLDGLASDLVANSVSEFNPLVSVLFKWLDEILTLANTAEMSFALRTELNHYKEGISQVLKSIFDLVDPNKAFPSDDDRSHLFAEILEALDYEETADEFVTYKEEPTLKSNREIARIIGLVND